jgi:hypothetical protein
MKLTLVPRPAGEPDDPVQANGSGSLRSRFDLGQPGGAFLLVVVTLVGAACSASVLFNGFYEFQVWGIGALALIAVAIAVLLVGPVHLGRIGRVAAGGIAGLTAWAALSILWAESEHRAWTEFNRWTLYALLFCLAVVALRTVAAARLVVNVLTGTFALVTAYVTIRLALGAGEDLFILYRLAEPIGYINGEAGFFLLALWAFLAVAESPASVPVRAAALGFAAAAGQLLVLTQSRAVVPAFALAALLVFIAAPGRVWRGWSILTVLAVVGANSPWLLDVYGRRSESSDGLPVDSLVQTAGLHVLIGAIVAAGIWAAASTLAPRVRHARARQVAIAPLLAVPLVAVVAALAVVGNPIDKLDEEWDRFVGLGGNAAATDRFTSFGGTRYDLWRIAKNQFADNPIEGVGAGNFNRTYYLERRTLENVRQPHSIEMQLLGELGLVGMLAFLLFVGAVMWGFLGRRRDTVAHRDTRVLVAAGGMFSVWLFHTSVDWLHIIPGVTGMALIAAALLVAHERPRQPEPEGRRRFVMGGLVAGVLVLLLLAVSVGRQYAAERYRERGQDQSDPVKALEDANTALDLNGSDVATYYLKASALAALDAYEPARDALIDATEEEPHNFVPWVLLGDIAVRRGDFTLAAEAYRRASDLNPRDTELAAFAEDPRSAVE